MPPGVAVVQHLRREQHHREGGKRGQQRNGHGLGRSAHGVWLTGELLKGGELVGRTTLPPPSPRRYPLQTTLPATTAKRSPPASSASSTTASGCWSRATGGSPADGKS